MVEASNGLTRLSLRRGEGGSSLPTAAEFLPCDLRCEPDLDAGYPSRLGVFTAAGLDVGENAVSATAGV